MKPYQEALIEIRKQAKNLVKTAEKVNLADSWGRTLSENLVAPEAIPSFDHSSMDGFAVRTSELKSGRNSFSVHSLIVAGDPPSTITKPQVAVQIMTGAPLPRGGFDAVIKVEETIQKKSLDGKNSSVEFECSVESGQNIRLIGSDFKEGDPVALAGTLIDSKLIMSLSAHGMSILPVLRKPKAWIVSTGTEIVECDQAKLLPGEIRNSSAPFLIHELKRLGCEVTYQGIMRDDATEYEALLKTALIEKIDLVVSTGAVSMGVHDFVKGSIENVGGEVIFHKVAIRPGKPILFARFPQGTSTLFFGLPGNPISTVVGTEFFIKPFLQVYYQNRTPSLLKAKISKRYSKPEGLRCFQKAHWYINESGESTVEPLDGQASFMIHSLVEANAWAVFLEDGTSIEAGSLVEVHLYE